MPPRNLLMIVADQFRADLLSGRLATVIPTPNLDRLAAGSVVLNNHHTVATPCGPARASLLTGLYPHQHGSLRNGTPLPRDLPNLATGLRALGHDPLLFGYTDTQPDPDGLHPNDPARRSYTGPMPGFTEVVEMREEAWRWLAYLRAQGYDVPDAGAADFNRLYRPQTGALGGPALYRAEDSDTAYLTDETINALDVRKSAPWCALVTYIRPHPPFVAPAPYHDMFDPAAIPAPLVAERDHPFLAAYREHPGYTGMFWGFDGDNKALTPDIVAKVRATYFGLVAELDHHIGRLLDWLDTTGQAQDTAVVFTADHGEMLGDFGLWGKVAPFPQASHVPFMMRAPGLAPRQIDEVTESNQVMACLLALMGGDGDAALAAFNRTEPARVEMEYGDPDTPTLFQNAWGCSADDLHGSVVHDRTRRVASFGNVLPELHLDPSGDTITGKPT